MDREVVLLDGVQDVYLLAAFGLDVTGIADLATHLRVERSAVEYKLIHGLVLLFYSTLLDEACAVDVSIIVAEELFLLTVVILDPVAEFVGCSLTGSVFLLLELSVELLEVYRVTLL